ncbi:MAG: hypothetical protein C0494_15860 [Sphingobium sp.]|nr:hypothetical protein [Sphingobium sp.]
MIGWTIWTAILISSHAVTSWTAATLKMRHWPYPRCNSASTNTKVLAALSQIPAVTSHISSEPPHRQECYFAIAEDRECSASR